MDDAVAVTEDGKAFTVRACLDVSSLDVVDAAGKSIVVANRPAQQHTRTRWRRRQKASSS